MTNHDNKLNKKNYLKKINLINKYNEAYYKNSKPIIDDFEYDNLKTLSKKRDKFSLRYKKYDNDLDKYMDLHNYYPMLLLNSNS